MKKILAAIAILAVSSTAASAGYYCEPTYYQRWDNYNQTYVMVRGRDRCYQTYEQESYYYAPQPAPRYNSGDVLIGGLLGFGLGYALNNNHHHHNRYYRRH